MSAGFRRAATARCAGRCTCATAGALLRCGLAARGPAGRVLAACSFMNFMMSSGFDGVAAWHPSSSQAGAATAFRLSPKTRAALQAITRNIRATPPQTLGTGFIRPQRRDFSLAQLRNCWRDSVAETLIRVIEIEGKIVLFEALRL